LPSGELDIMTTVVFPALTAVVSASCGIEYVQWLKYKLGGPGTLKNLGPCGNMVGPT